MTSSLPGAGWATTPGLATFIAALNSSNRRLVDCPTRPASCARSLGSVVTPPARSHRRAFGRREAVVDGNVARVLARVFGVELDIKSSAGQRALWQLAGDLVPADDPGDFNQGLMELGQSLCTPRSPDCSSCPLGGLCRAKIEGRQERLPVVAPRKKRGEKPLIEQYAALVQRKDSLLLGKRPASGLYAGLWEVPAAADRRSLLAALPGLELETETTFVREQELSHRMLRIRVFRGELKRKPRTALDYSSLRWHPLAALTCLGVSSATSAIVAALT